MKQLSDLEVQIAATLKAYRTMIRLKHSLKADEEISRVLPKVEERINNAIAMGDPLTITAEEIFNEV